MTNRTVFTPEVLAIVHAPGAPTTPVQHHSVHSPGPLCLLVISAAALLPLAGCGAGTTITSGAVPTSTTITGRVHGGQQPVVGATVTLYAAGIAGYGSAPAVIVSTTTDNNGNFTLPRPYTCPTVAPITYIVATGGNPGAGINNNLAEAALLPACTSLTASTFISITEVTTVAAAYALAPFASISPGSTKIGSPATNILGITNALGPASNLADTATGNARAATAISGLVLPTAEINTLANILAACVNTGTNGVPSTTCNTLFAAATPPGTGASAPTDTFQAAINIALNPGNNVAALYSLALALAPFQPTLGGATAPSDFAVGIQYNGGNLAASGGTTGLDIDTLGNAWAAVSGTSSINANVAEISPSGTLLSGTNGFINGSLGIPYCLAIDSATNVYTVDYYYSEVVKMSSSGTGATGLQAASLYGPVGIAVNSSDFSSWLGNVYLGTNVTHMTSAGADATGSPYTSQDVPIGIAIDSNGNVWAANADDGQNGTGNGFLSKFVPNGSGGFTPTTFPTGASTYPFDLAIDNANGVWTTELFGVAKYNNAGVIQSPVGGYLPQSPATGPDSVVIDGLGRAWVSNTPMDTNFNALGVPGSVTVYSNTGTLISTSSTTTSNGALLGYTAIRTIPQEPFTPQGIKIDASGNVWITGVNVTGTQYITELVGIAAPVVTPLSVAVLNHTIGVRP